MDSALVRYVMRLAADDSRTKSDAEVRALIARAWERARRAPAHLADAWRDDAAIVELLYLTASRISQVLRLRWDQVRDDAIHFPAHKRGAPRVYALVGRIRTIIRATPRRGEYVFPPAARARKPYREDIKRFWKAVAPAGFTPHGLRHSAITAALYAGEAPGAVADRGGWKDLQMLTRTYGHVFRGRLSPTPRAGSRTAVTAGRRRRTGAGK
jgi:integrase